MQARREDLAASLAPQPKPEPKRRLLPGGGAFARSRAHLAPVGLNRIDQHRDRLRARVL